MTLFDPETEQPEYVIGLLGVEPSSTRAKNGGSFETRLLARAGQNQKPVNVRLMHLQHM